MKLFQQLLVAPAALGLMAPIAATAAELNINDVSNYTSPSVETQNISNFSDVYPTDWAYKALNNLRERHGCKVSSPNGSITRYEAAALLNKCLDNVAQVNAEEQSLLDEFGSELAVIRGRLDVLESDIDGIEAGVFSSTTKLSGQTTFVIGGVSYNSGAASAANPNESVTFNYDTRIALDSSFNGDDLLKTVIRSGNFGSGDPFTTASVAALETASSNVNDNLKIVRNYYQFPIGEDFTATVGALVRQDDMLGVWPSAYPSDSVLDSLTYAGSASDGAYSLTEGQGAGITWTKDNLWGMDGSLVTSFLFVSENGKTASSDASTAGGLLTEHGSDDVTGQVAWVGEGYTLAAAYTVADGGQWEDGVPRNSEAQDYKAWVLSGVYDFDTNSEWIPTSISAGIGGMSPENADQALNVETENTWSVGLLWNDAFTVGNNLGFGLGSAEGHNQSDNHYDDPLAYEVFYEMAVSDNITVTPALFVVQRDNQANDDVTGGLVKTTFRF